MQLFWFKRDLRVFDNRALSLAAARGPVLPIYVFEPEMWACPDASARHLTFVHQSLSELHNDLARAGQPLVTRFGPILDVLDDLRQTYSIQSLWSHQETGNAWSYERDKRVAAWCRDNAIQWHDIQNHGVVRPLKSRNGWAMHWDRFMAEPTTPTPILTPITDAPFLCPSARDLAMTPDNCSHAQQGGRRAGQERLASFLDHRGRTYRSAMSSPLDGAAACSRISPHLAWGSVSLREVTQATWSAQMQPRSLQWKASLKSFNSRLHWHCHFIQKLEDEPRLEWENMHPAYNGLRPDQADPIKLAAWANGETGLPFVDACMRSLRATGWLNFRMRAMVMAVASYHLWLDWKATGHVLARYFTDYEPGIHWSQVQMQSGTTGINTVRVYNPIKQGYDQDPTGAFTRTWVPELELIDDLYLQEPWKAPNAATILGKSYPMPIVDVTHAAREAKDRIWAVRRTEGFRDGAAKVLKKHASRKPATKRARPKAASNQLSLPL